MHDCIRNIVGQPPRGIDFFPRPEIIKLIYRRLENDSHIHIAAPRRVGKTAVMRYLEDNPREGFEFKYIITQSIGDPVVFFELLLDTIKEFRSVSAKTKNAVTGLLSKIKNIQIMGNKVDFHSKDADCLRECKTIIRNYTTDGNKVILMIDEFPQTVENILQEKGAAEAVRFLHANRELREESSSQIRFLYTGSIGLKTLCSRLNAIDALNTMTTIEMGPLSTEEGVILCELVLQCAKVAFQAEAILHLLKKIHWLIPFHIQLALQELIDEKDRGVLMIDTDAIDRAIDKMTYRRNDQFFEHYHIHLLKMFPVATPEYHFIKSLLTRLSISDTIPKKEIYELANEKKLFEGIDRIMNALEYDGYVHEECLDTAPVYRFTSLLLRIWWRKNMN